MHNVHGRTTTEKRSSDPYVVTDINEFATTSKQYVLSKLAIKNAYIITRNQVLFNGVVHKSTLGQLYFYTCPGRKTMMGSATTNAEHCKPFNLLKPSGFFPYHTV